MMKSTKRSRGKSRSATPQPNSAKSVKKKRRLSDRDMAVLAEAGRRKAEYRDRFLRHCDEANRQGYRLPADVEAFLLRLFPEPLYLPIGKDEFSRDEVMGFLREAFLDGCKEGYIERLVVDREPRRARAINANAAKRKKPRERDGAVFTLDDRDAEIVSEYRALRAAMMLAGDAQYRLATKHGLTDKQIRNILSKANRAVR